MLLLTYLLATTTYARSFGHTFSPSLLGQKPIIGHWPGTALVDTLAGMMKVVKPVTHGTATPKPVIHLR